MLACLNVACGDAVADQSRKLELSLKRGMI